MNAHHVVSIVAAVGEELKTVWKELVGRQGLVGMVNNPGVVNAGKEAVLAEYPMGKRMTPGPEARSGRRDLTGLMQPSGDPYAEHLALDDAWLHSTWTEGIVQIFQIPPAPPLLYAQSSYWQNSRQNALLILAN